MALPLDAILAGKLAASVGLNLQSSIRSSEKIPKGELPQELKTQLAANFAINFGRDWSIPASAPPLSEREIHFLETHKATELSFSSPQQNPMMQFCVQIVQAALTQAATNAVNEMLAPTSPPRSANRGPASTGEELESDDKNKVRPGDVETHKKDPSIETMKKISSDDIKRNVGSSVTRLVKQEISQQGAGRLSAEALKAQETFIRHAGQVVGIAAKSGQILSKAEEIGWEGAVAETVKSTAIKFVSKYSARAVTTLAGCTNPVWCAGVVTTIIADTFSVTETAPPDRDERVPIPHAPLSETIRSRLPELDPVVPSIRKPR